MCETHTHVLVRDCSLFPGSSCKTWVRVGKVVPLSELWNPRAQTSLDFAAVVGKKMANLILIFLYSVFSPPPSTSNLHFIITIPSCWLYLLISGIDAVMNRKKIPPASKTQIKAPSHNSGFNTKKKHHFSGAFAANFKHFFLSTKWFLLFCCIIAGNNHPASPQGSSDTTFLV